VCALQEQICERTCTRVGDVSLPGDDCFSLLAFFFSTCLTAVSSGTGTMLMEKSQSASKACTLVRLTFSRVVKLRLIMELIDSEVAVMHPKP
jgi:hypothetical protein